MNESYFSSIFHIFLFLIGGILFVVVALLVSKIIRPNRPNPQKLATYESGEEAQGTPWVQSNIRFYVLALLFILFEVEVVVLFPWASVFSNEEFNGQTNGLWGWFSFVEILIFVLMLAVGLAYAWVNGHLDFMKPSPKPGQFKSAVPKELYDKINEHYANQ